GVGTPRRFHFAAESFATSLTAVVFLLWKPQKLSTKDFDLRRTAMKRLFKLSLFVFTTLLLVGCTALAQKKDGSMQCRAGEMVWNEGEVQSNCEIREQTVPEGGAMNVDAGRNGGGAGKGRDPKDAVG